MSIAQASHQNIWSSKKHW